MFDLNTLCGENISRLDLGQVQERCTEYAHAFALDVGGAKFWMMVGAGILFCILVLVRRLVQGEGAGPAILGFFEGLVYGALAAYAGASAGLLFALWFSPVVVGSLLVIIAALALTVAIWAVAAGDGDGGWKVLGFFELLILASGLVVVAVFAFLVPGEGAAGDDYANYLMANSILFCATGLIGALVVTLFRGYHWAAGWLLVPINASWGLIGNLLGLMNHAASWNCYANHGDVVETRRFYVRYENGFRLLSGYAFTEGDAMTSGTSAEAHESAHVLQHFIAGPVYPISHAAWFALLLFPGIIAGGAASTRNVAEGIVDFCYYNNPWEVIAYAFGGTRNDGTTTLITPDWLAWLLTVIWICGAIAGLVVYLVFRW